MSAKRYMHDFPYGPVEVHPNGDLVSYSYYAALLARHNALREAVEWERECRDVEAWMNRRPWSWGDAEIWASLAAARAEVDRLIANEGAADCEGEG